MVRRDNWSCWSLSRLLHGLLYILWTGEEGDQRKKAKAFFPLPGGFFFSAPFVLHLWLWDSLPLVPSCSFPWARPVLHWPPNFAAVTESISSLHTPGRAGPCTGRVISSDLLARELFSFGSFAIGFVVHSCTEGVSWIINTVFGE